MHACHCVGDKLHDKLRLGCYNTGKRCVGPVQKCDILTVRSDSFQKSHAQIYQGNRPTHLKSS